MKCLMFDGKSKYILKHDEKYNTFPISISCMMKSNNISSDYTLLISKYINSSADGWSLNTMNGKISFFIFNNGSCGCFTSGNIDVCDNKWHRIKVVISNNIELYIDGKLDFSIKNNSKIKNTNKTDICLGRHSQGAEYYYKGYIADIAISDIMPSYKNISQYKMTEKYNKNLLYLNHSDIIEIPNVDDPLL